MQQQPRDIEKQKIGRTHNTAVRFCPSGPHLQHGRNRQRSGSRIWKKNTKMGATTASSGRRKVWAKARTRKPAQDRSCRKAAETEEESEEGGQEKARGKRGAQPSRVELTARSFENDGQRFSEKGVRLAQKMQVGPCILMGIQLLKAEVGPVSGPTWSLRGTRWYALKWRARCWRFLLVLHQLPHGLKSARQENFVCWLCPFQIYTVYILVSKI